MEEEQKSPRSPLFVEATANQGRTEHQARIHLVKWNRVVVIGQENKQQRSRWETSTLGILPSGQSRHHDNEHDPTGTEQTQEPPESTFQQVAAIRTQSNIWFKTGKQEFLPFHVDQKTLLLPTASMTLLLLMMIMMMMIMVTYKIHLYQPPQAGNYQNQLIPSVVSLNTFNHWISGSF